MLIPDKEISRYIKTLDTSDGELFAKVKKSLNDDTLALAVCVVSKWEELKAKEDKIGDNNASTLPIASDFVEGHIKRIKELAEDRGLLLITTTK